MPEPKPNKPQSTGRERPGAPRGEKPAKPQAAKASADDPFRVVEDESDFVNFSARQPTNFAETAPFPPRHPAHQSLFLRRTVVPILLTGGVGLPTLGILWFKTDADSPFRLVGMGLPVGLIVTGAMFLFVGIVNVLFLRRELRGPGAAKHASPKNQ
jgi:hypothetical protein